MQVKKGFKLLKKIFKETTVSCYSGKSVNGPVLKGKHLWKDIKYVLQATSIRFFFLFISPRK